MDITNSINDAKIPLKGINARTLRDQTAIMILTLEITDAEQLNRIIRRLKKVDGVFEVTRNKN
jgi:guanosine-3',5'-bis(diphosphate) 3'-pyrophosphohydrolase